MTPDKTKEEILKAALVKLIMVYVNWDKSETPMIDFALAVGEAENILLDNTAQEVKKPLL